LSLEQALDPRDWQVAIHPDDLPELGKARRKILTTEKPADVEARMRPFVSGEPLPLPPRRDQFANP